MPRSKLSPPHSRRPEPHSPAEIRAESVRTISIIYSMMALACAAAALGFHWLPGLAGFDVPRAGFIASAFAAIAAMDLVLLSVWERVFAVEH